jgi:hypothetical protein
MTQARQRTIALAGGEDPRFVPNFMTRTVGELAVTLADPS